MSASLTFLVAEASDATWRKPATPGALYYCLNQARAFITKEGRWEKIPEELHFMKHEMFETKMYPHCSKPMAIVADADGMRHECRNMECPNKYASEEYIALVLLVLIFLFLKAMEGIAWLIHLPKSLKHA